MKRFDIIARQERIVHILLVVSAAIGLTWVIWRHQYLAAHDPMAAPTHAVPAH